VIHIELPPLRARGGDVLVLAQHFIDLHAARAGKTVTGLTPAAAERLIAYPWPGNVRELQNCIERAIALTRHPEIQVEDLPETVRSFKRRTSSSPRAIRRSWSRWRKSSAGTSYASWKPRVATSRSRHRSSVSRGRRCTEA
jgi:DNA-binding NtrC family response regulator